MLKFLARYIQNYPAALDGVAVFLSALWWLFVAALIIYLIESKQ